MSEIRKHLHEQLDLLLDSGDKHLYEKALLVATLVHAKQKDRAGASYIRHPVRVAEAFEGTEEERGAALLHDALEDCKQITEEHLRDLGFSDLMIDLVKDLTKDESLSYEQNLLRILRSPREASRRLKIQDVLDNLKLRRLKGRYRLTQKDLERIQKYVDALNVLGYQG